MMASLSIKSNVIPRSIVAPEFKIITDNFLGLPNQSIIVIYRISDTFMIFVVHKANRYGSFLKKDNGEIHFFSAKTCNSELTSVRFQFQPVSWAKYVNNEHETIVQTIFGGWYESADLKYFQVRTTCDGKVMFERKKHASEKEEPVRNGFWFLLSGRELLHLGACRHSAEFFRTNTEICLARVNSPK